ncbi:SDR family oxidoreductase [Pseudonocardia sp. ICBG1293]|uniref:SDR family oxidoreductase n=1 Tax=Pseudonocardia sp. ICBG1293 TaxID=2844382 RepID=UPI001CCF0209|nr:SDR family oxidoreductase [Pseudonocardia sp. ICBG1293]
MTDLFDIGGRTVVVTGGTRGIGAMVAEGLRDAGARVLVTSRKVDACRAASERLGCPAVPADVSTPEGVAAVLDGVHAEFGGSLDVLVNNAGVTWGAPLDDFPRAGWDRVLGTNVVGLFELTTALLPALRRSAGGGHAARVVNIGSVDGLRVPVFENYSYSAAKAAVHMLTRHLAAVLAQDGVLVNAIAPGAFPSDMTAAALASDSGRTLIENAVPLRRLGTADDIVGAGRYLVSPAGSYVTGVVLPVDGGITGCGT